MTEAALSYAHGASNVPLIGETIGAHFDRTVARWGERPALVVRQQGVRWSYRELGEKVDAFAAGLLALGLQPGERIGIWSPNNAEWVITQFATAKAGLILVNINPAYRLAEVEYALNKVGCRALITATSFKTSDYVGMVNTLAPELRHARPGHLDAAKLPSLKMVIQIGDTPAAGMIPFESVFDLGAASHRAQLAELAAKLQFDEAINIQFTSGTTGLPKGATLTHHNILNNGYFLGEAMHYTEHDKVCIPVPLYHCFGMVIGNLACITHGAAMVYPGEGFDPLATLQTVAEERCTSLYGVPTMFIAQLEHPEFSKFDLTQPAHRHDGGRALPDRGDATLHPRHAPERDDHRLRHDRDQPGQHADGARRSVGAAGLDGRARASACRGEDRRYRRAHRAARHAGRVLHPRLFGDAGLLG